MLRLSNVATFAVGVLLSARVAAYAEGEKPWSKGPFECYEVTALSATPRDLHGKPEDGRLSTSVRIVAAQGEYEPASLVLVPRTDVAKLELSASDLVGPGKNIPSSAIDIKVVKYWYQAGTAWYSYFKDPNRRELVPELLLNDETMVKVDHQKKDNFLRVGGEYMHVSYPRTESIEPFNFLTAPVSDSKTLQPVTLSKGENKQFWITVKVPDDAAAGNYVGKITLTANGKPAGIVEVRLRVLPYKLPMPKTYYNTSSDYLVSIYGSSMLDLGHRFGLTDEESKAFQRNMDRNLIEHNVFNSILGVSLGYEKDREKEKAAMLERVKAHKENGFSLKPALTGGWLWPMMGEDKDPEKFDRRIAEMAKALKEALGHDDIYVTSWDEATEGRVKTMRDLVETSQANGLKLWVTTAIGKHFNLAGYAIDYANHGGFVNRDESALWHSVGAKVTSYAGPHTGPENPDAFRRLEGLARYKANYDGSYNYIYFESIHPTMWKEIKNNVWNDFIGDQFRQMSMVYPTVGGMIDTIAWEGFREGIDDVRYATKLKQDAEEAIASGNLVATRVAKKALMWLELTDANTANLDTMRLEMIEHISKISEAMKK